MKRNQATDCNGCGSEERWIVHNIRHKGIFRRLCTSCVLKFHPGFFCSVCFLTYSDLSSIPIDRVFCLKCPSIAHLDCIVKDKDSPSSLYLCPPCSNPNFSFFDFDSCKKGKCTSSGASMDVNSAKVLVAAAQISSNSMSRAVSATRLEAESRLKEAAFSRKDVKNALQLLVNVTAKAKLDINKEANGKNEIVGVVNSPMTDHNKNNSGRAMVTTVDSAVVVQRRLHEQFEAVGIVDNKESSILNSSSDIVKRSSDNNVSVGDGNRLKLGPGAKVNGNMSSNLTNSQSQIVEYKENNGLHSALPVTGDLQQPPRNSHTRT